MAPIEDRNCRFWVTDQFNAETDSNGAILIDRSPEKFRVILEYLRTGVIDVPDSIKIDSLIIESDYYGFTGLTNVLKAPNSKAIPSTPGPAIIFTTELQVVLFSPHGISSSNITAQEALSPYLNWVALERHPVPPAWDSEFSIIHTHATLPGRYLYGTCEVLGGCLKLKFGDHTFYGFFGPSDTSSYFVLVVNSQPTKFTLFKW